MRARLVFSLLSAVSIAAVASAQPGHPRATGCAEQFLGQTPAPSLEQLQALTRWHYPDLAAKATAPARLAVGFLLDDQCRVLRHTVGILPATYSEDIVHSMFPGATQAGMPAGIGDAVPPDDRQQVRRPRLVVSWQVQVSAARRAQMVRQRKRLEALNLSESR